MSISELRKLLTPGTEFIGEFIGKNRQVAHPDNVRTRRKVQSCSAKELVSVFLEGTKVGEPIYLTWKGVTARRVDNDIFLTNEDAGGDFLKLTLTPAGST